MITRQHRLKAMRALARSLARKRIVRVETNEFDDGRDDWAFSPAIYLDDGSVLGFVVSETETGEYGVDMALSELRVRASVRRRKGGVA